MKAIAKALVSAQQAFGPALKTKTNPHFKSKFADLAACVEAVIDGLNSNGIALIQNLHECDDGVIVETIFLHESGESYSAGKLHVPEDKHTPQYQLKLRTMPGRLPASGLSNAQNWRSANCGRCIRPQQEAPEPKVRR